MPKTENGQRHPDQIRRRLEFLFLIWTLEFWTHHYNVNFIVKPLSRKFEMETTSYHWIELHLWHKKQNEDDDDMNRLFKWRRTYSYFCSVSFTIEKCVCTYFLVQLRSNQTAVLPIHGTKWVLSIKTMWCYVKVLPHPCLLESSRPYVIALKLLMAFYPKGYQNH